MLTSFFPAHYKILYIVPTVYIFTLLYAHTHLQNLQTREETDKNRVLLTVTATFTYHRELRWVWLFLVLFTTVIYCGVAPGMFKRFFLADSRYLNFVESHSNVKKPSNRLITILNCSQVVWTLCLCGVVFLIDGQFPAKQEDIAGYIWGIHFGMLFGMLIGVAVNIYCFLRLLHFADSDYRRTQHSIFRKYIIAGGYFLSVVLMMGSSGVVKILKIGSWDLVCIFEYSVVLFLNLFVIDQWSGMVGSRCLDVRWSDDFDDIENKVLKNLHFPLRSFKNDSYRNKSDRAGSDASNASSNNSETVILLKSETPKKLTRVDSGKQKLFRSRSAYPNLTQVERKIKNSKLANLTRTISENVNKFD